MELLGRNDIGIHPEPAQHPYVGTESGHIGLVDDGGKASLGEATIPSDHVVPALEISQGEECEGSLGRESIMHPDQRTGPRGHPAAYLRLVEDVNYRATSCEVHRDRASDDSCADHDHSYLARWGHIFCAVSG